jgi:hypothetical protein
MDPVQALLRELGRQQGAEQTYSEQKSPQRAIQHHAFTQHSQPVNYQQSYHQQQPLKGVFYAQEPIQQLDDYGEFQASLNALLILR